MKALFYQVPRGRSRAKAADLFGIPSLGHSAFRPFEQFGIRHSPFAIRHSPFGIRHSAFGIRH
jgi:hypothetical protein